MSIGKVLSIKKLGRNSDNKLFKLHMNWEPTQSLFDGMNFKNIQMDK